MFDIKKAPLFILTALFLSCGITEKKTEIKIDPAVLNWKEIDKKYYYIGELGAFYSNEQTEFRLWTPTASEVDLLLYEHGSDSVPSETLKMKKGQQAVWSVIVPGDLWGKFYNYAVTNNGVTKKVLDPYAKSMAASAAEHELPGKGAIVDPSLIGPELKFAKIENFSKPEDAIVYEIHIRDFTSDPDISTKAQFGTYKAFIEKLDYLKKLGITHVQLLPVQNSLWGDETANKERLLDYSLHSNYNWGYNPHSYFAPEGMYSENPNDPELRIRELKELINAIHSRGMGVILDVVYNHTADLSLLNDIVPDYYHFVTASGESKTSYGGGRLGTTHAMTRKLILNSIEYWIREYKIDGIRYDLMGEMDTQTVQMAYDLAIEMNPNFIMHGEGWRTFAGDDGENVVPADQDWMGQTNAVACFSDEIRNEMKSGYGIEGQPRFITGGARPVNLVFDNIIAKPGNMSEDDPGDVLQYLAAHDNLTLHDAIAQSILKDPAVHEEEIQKRIRLGNVILLTSQGRVFLHGGQEYGRTKQWLADHSPDSEFIKMEGFEHPFFIENSYNASDAVNLFDWDKVTREGLHKHTMEYTRGMIRLRKSTDAFRLENEETIKNSVSLIQSPDIKPSDLVIGYSSTASTGETYYVFINADSSQRRFSLSTDLTKGTIVVDSDESGTSPVSDISGVRLFPDYLLLDPLTAAVIRLEATENK